MINDIYDIYPKDQTDFYVQCFNFTKSQYELRYIKFNSTSNQYESFEVPNAHSESIFDVNNYSDNSIHFITSSQLETIDIENKSITGIIPLYEKSTNPIKISSDISIVEPSNIAVGINSDIFICDTKSQKISTHIPNAHSNSVLTLQY